MQARFEMTVGKSNLEAILHDQPPGSEHWNEAQNRFQFVDRLLLECLGWEHPVIGVERSDENGGRSDYELGRPIKATIEAKRQAVKFDILPAGKPNATRKLRPLFDACPNLRAAILQVIAYCSLNGSQIAAVCNGPQLVIFQTNTPGSSPLDGECLVFNGFSSYAENFSTLWRFLSPEGISENRAHRILAEKRNARVPEKASTSILDLTKFRYRNNFQENLRAIGSILLDEIDLNPNVKSDFYRECYVDNEANNRHLLLSKNVIASRYKRVSENGIVPANLGTKVQKGRLRFAEEVSTSLISARPMVVIGDVGVGKTSFFENLYESLDQKQKSATFFIHINLGIKASLTENINNYVVNAIIDELKSRYNTDIYKGGFVDLVYSRDIAEYENSVFARGRADDPEEFKKKLNKFVEEKASDKSAHLLRSISYLVNANQKQFILVIDNADQRSFETQQAAFLIAEELAGTRNLLVFVALRPSTFYKSKLTGALSGYQNRLLTISPPPADEVLRKRITFAVRVAEGKVAHSALVNIQLNLDNVVHFLNALLRSVKSRDDIRGFLSNITGGNTRLVIELMASFCGSPNVEAEKIVQIEKEENRYIVPLHEFAKHALIGQYAYYNDLSSPVAQNVFDVTAPDPREHFLAILIVAFLTSSSGIRDNDGFSAAHNIMDEMRRLGFSDDQTAESLRRLASKRLIETPHGHYREVDVPMNEEPTKFSFRATSIGIYHIRFWVGSFSFLDAVCIDTPIFDEDARKIVFSNASSHDIETRYRRAEVFKNYLEEAWHAANFGVPYYDFIAVIFGQKYGFDSVRARVQRGGPRKQRPTGQYNRR